MSRANCSHLSRSRPLWWMDFSTRGSVSSLGLLANYSFRSGTEQ